MNSTIVMGDTKLIRSVKTTLSEESIDSWVSLGRIDSPKESIQLDVHLKILDTNELWVGSLQCLRIIIIIFEMRGQYILQNPNKDKWQRS